MTQKYVTVEGYTSPASAWSLGSMMSMAESTCQTRQQTSSRDWNNTAVHQPASQPDKWNYTKPRSVTGHLAAVHSQVPVPSPAPPRRPGTAAGQQTAHSPLTPVRQLA